MNKLLFNQKGGSEAVSIIVTALITVILCMAILVALDVYQDNNLITTLSKQFKKDIDEEENV
ncbi:hypothetical protein CPAV1605_324 [seawater metagenome]|uniref:Uncharacterized protein n=1 Tax=seawater metagenome TaxID=1561972 RepID=A0A5E8CJ10_9ZZZZ